jgi:hypothetical protein
MSGFALARGRAVWAHSERGNTEGLDYVLTASVGDRTARVLDGGYVTGCDEVPCSQPSVVDDGQSIFFSAGGVWAVVGSSKKFLFQGNFSPIAVSGSYVVGAYPGAPADEVIGDPGFPAGIEVHARNDGSLVRRTELDEASGPDGPAISDAYIATLTASNGVSRLDVYDLDSGQKLWSRNGLYAYSQIVFAGRQIVVAGETRIRLFDPATERVTAIIPAHRYVDGVDYEAGRLFWLEEFGNDRFRIRSVALGSRPEWRYAATNSRCSSRSRGRCSTSPFAPCGRRTLRTPPRLPSC